MLWILGTLCRPKKGASNPSPSKQGVAPISSLSLKTRGNKTILVTSLRPEAEAIIMGNGYWGIKPINQTLQGSMESDPSRYYSRSINTSFVLSGRLPWFGWISLEAWQHSLTWYEQTKTVVLMVNLQEEGIWSSAAVQRPCALCSSTIQNLRSAKSLKSWGSEKMLQKRNWGKIKHNWPCMETWSRMLMMLAVNKTIDLFRRKPTVS